MQEIDGLYGKIGFFETPYVIAELDPFLEHVYYCSFSCYIFPVVL
jgi:hypothetical protein